MTDTPTRVAVIMAGGSGERFWPLSRQAMPKQLLRLTSDTESLLEEAIGRVSPVISAEHVYIATGRQLRDVIRAANTGIPADNVLAEPCKRNTAGCLCYVVAELMARFGDDADNVSMAILTADHLIGDHAAFRANVETALKAAESQQSIGVMGVRPTRPETGYGYIETPADATTLNGSDEAPVYPVTRFREKPNHETAEEFIATGRFYWNSGMFFWTIGAFMRELTNASRVHADATRAMADALAKGDTAEVDSIFASLPDISIDYALMERAERVVMTKAAFDWDDVGSWDSLDRTKDHDVCGNVATGDPVLIDSYRCVVYNEPGAEQIAVAAVGVSDLAIIVSKDGILVVPKDRAQDVKKAVAILKKRGASQL